MTVSAPPFLKPCYNGTEIYSKKKLITCKHTVKEIEKIIDVDSLGFLNIDHLPLIAGGEKQNGFCNACFSSKYPTEIPDESATNKYENNIKK